MHIIYIVYIYNIYIYNIYIDDKGARPKPPKSQIWLQFTMFYAHPQLSSPSHLTE